MFGDRYSLFGDLYSLVGVMLGLAYLQGILVALAACQSPYRPTVSFKQVLRP